jgi:hypothetical protein
MDVDWEFEVGGDAPVIDAAWSGFIDLRRNPESAGDLPETDSLPGLAEALIKLNAAASPVWTSKCDVWRSLEAGDFDADELDAPPGSSAHAMGSYIDLLPSGGRQWLLPEAVASECKELCGLLHAVPLRCCRADLVIRRAVVTSSPMHHPVQFGVTAYLTACGESPAAASQALQAALAALADAFGSTRR